MFLVCVIENKKGYFSILILYTGQPCLCGAWQVMWLGNHGHNLFSRLMFISQGFWEVYMEGSIYCSSAGWILMDNYRTVVMLLCSVAQLDPCRHLQASDTYSYIGTYHEGRDI